MAWTCSPGQILVFPAERGRFEDQDIWRTPQLFCWSDRFCPRPHPAQDLSCENSTPPKINVLKSVCSLSQRNVISFITKQEKDAFVLQTMDTEFTVQLASIFLMLYSSMMEGVWSASPVLCRLITHMLVCLNPLLSNDTSSLKIVSHLLGRPGYVTSFIQAMRHQQDMHLTWVRDPRFKLQPPKCP